MLAAAGAAALIGIFVLLSVMPNGFVALPKTELNDDAGTVPLPAGVEAEADARDASVERTAGALLN